MCMLKRDIDYDSIRKKSHKLKKCQEGNNNVFKTIERRKDFKACFKARFKAKRIFLDEGQTMLKINENFSTQLLLSKDF